MPAETGPAPPVQPLTKGAADQMQAAAQAAVVDSVEQPTESTKTVTGTLQSASQTVPGALATSTTVTATGLALGHYADLPELEPTAWGSTLIYQGIKHWHLVDQDRHKWFILPALGFIIAFGITWFMTQGNLWDAAAHGFRTCWLSAPNAMANYHTVKPLGWFSSAEEPASRMNRTQEEGATNESTAVS